MRKVLYILAQLTDSDVTWLTTHGRKRRLAEGTRLIVGGEPVESIYFVIDGYLRVSMADDAVIATLGAGEVVGEISFVDSAPPLATVTTDGPCTVLEVSRSSLEQELSSNQGFSARFHRALALFLADRLRNTVHHLGYGEAGQLEEEQVMEDELDEALLDSVSYAGEQFERMIKALSQAPEQG